MQFEIRCKKSKRAVYGIDRTIWNKHFAGHTFVFDIKDIMNRVTIVPHFEFYLPALYSFEKDICSEHEREKMECWLIYPGYKRRIQ